MKLTIKTIDNDQYLDFGQKQDNWSFLHSIEQKRKLQNGQYDTSLIGFVDEKDELKAAALIAKAPVAKIYQYCLIPGGILMNYEDEELIKETTKTLKPWLASQNILYMQMSPYLPLIERDQNGQVVEGGFDHTNIPKLFKKAGYKYLPPEKGYDLSKDPMWMSVLYFDGRDIDTLLKDMDQQTRWSINRARKFDLSIREARNDADLKKFTDMMIHTGQRNNFDGGDEDYYRREMAAWQDNADLLLAFMEPSKTIESQERLKEDSQNELAEVEKKLEETPSSKKFNKKKKVLLEAIELADKKIDEAQKLCEKYGDEILLAGCIFLNTVNETVYMHSGAYDEFFKYNAPFAIHYEEIKRAIAAGRKSYNFFGISGNFNKDEEGYSLFDFKRGFGSTVVENMGTLILPVKDIEFSIYNRLKKVV
ncbi:peptidoglycan bridge formation glycyltransferase FemA/FemB family protein [Ileibacterium valens]|uniref:Aminoacyltransferase FemA n=1 Tax=Ileibacterium valens TaxID=1862668 RepID=A0A1U7NHJ7_9FIRM|nr:peptidoglycan bridge formation glycyltransferase FemA/FemB family protein [Ileibacterium valens]OLU39310.1 hypothetical protein BM735_07720 [Erysipelotrichaceae bacterium NYU-BL-F16]OLU40864.1 hypothetical protein BO224_04815 [Erysipelotrichaceae bacterium NYU-BL-E8]OLU41155.1 hypothetical protein BO222_03725 [Ileibacterium valens]